MPANYQKEPPAPDAAWSTLGEHRLFRHAAGASAVIFSLIGSYATWFYFNSLAGLLLVLTISAAWLAWAYRHNDLLPAAGYRDYQSSEQPTVQWQFWPGIIAVAIAWYLAVTGKQIWIPLPLYVAAEFFSKLPFLGSMATGLRTRKNVGIIMLVIMVVASGFRFYKAGEIPYGLITVDEPRIFIETPNLIKQRSNSFTIVPSSSAVPFYAQDIASQLFGGGILGGRMASLLSGLICVGLGVLLGAQLGGLALGFIFGGFLAVAQWPVSFSRAEYLMTASLVPVLAMFWLLILGLRRGKAWAIALSGIFFSANLNAYQAGRATGFVLFAAVAAWYLLQKEWRASLKSAAAPFLAGTLVGAGPLLAWIFKDGSAAIRVYFEPFYNPVISSSQVLASSSLLARVAQAFAQVPAELLKVTTMFSTAGGMRPWYFIQNSPVIDSLTLAFLLLGMAWCLAHLRRPLAVFLLAWWFLGLLPTLLGNPSYNMDERRIMMSLLPTFLIASVGLLALGNHLGTWISSKRKAAILLALGLIFFAGYASIQAKRYFVDYARNAEWLAYNHANYDQMLRGIFRQDRISPVSVVSFRKPDEDRWWGANPLNELGEHWSVLGDIPRTICSQYPAYFENGGMFGAIREMIKIAEDRDPLIVLTPFHFYLEPLLEKMGAQKVEEIALVRTEKGFSFSDVGMAWDKKVATRIWRLTDFDPAKIEALTSCCAYSYTVEELTPPPKFVNRENFLEAFILDEKHRSAILDYDRDPKGWKAVGNRADFKMPDPWFWATANNFPGNVRLPLRLKGAWNLLITEGGEYRFGASATVYTRLRIGGKDVFTYLPAEREVHEMGREGWMGPSIRLEPGTYAFELEQVGLSYSGNFNHLIRALWQKPGGGIETLPLAFLQPKGEIK